MKPKTGRRVLFIFAHQDDEYSAAPWIVEELESGASVTCLYLTEGAARVGPDIRDAESRAVLRLLGVERDQIAFLSGRRGRIADLKLAMRCEEGLEMIDRWREKSAFVPHRIYAPSYEGGHPDHDAAHVIAAIVAADLAILHETWHFSLYNAYRLPRPLFWSLRQLPSRQAVRFPHMSLGKRWWTSALCWRYRSQWTTWMGLFPGALLERAILCRECVVRFDLKRLSLRPHPGELLYERRFGMTYRTFAESIGRIAARIRTS